MIAHEYGSKKPSRFFLRCLLLSLVGCFIFYAAYMSIDTSNINSVWFITNDSEYVREMGLALPERPWNDSGRIFYNRVPKCGSTTMITLIQKLAARNGFVHVNSKVYNEKIVDEQNQRRIVEWVKEIPSPCSFDKHVYFINFTRFGAIAPIYINVIRDPVERIISSFFFRRMTAKNNSEAIRAKPSANWLNKKFHHCVTDGDPECMFVAGQNYIAGQLPYFCGQESLCSIFNEPDALQKAKRNIEDSYAVVGILEHMKISLQVMEAIMPEFFTGAFNLYRSLDVHMNQNLQKQDVPEKIKLKLKEHLTAEYDLYNFAVQRLHQQYKQYVRSD